MISEHHLTNLMNLPCETPVVQFQDLMSRCFRNLRLRATMSPAWLWQLVVFPRHTDEHKIHCFTGCTSTASTMPTLRLVPVKTTIPTYSRKPYTCSNLPGREKLCGLYVVMGPHGRSEATNKGTKTNATHALANCKIQARTVTNHSLDTTCLFVLKQCILLLPWLR